MYPEQNYYLLQVITSPDSAPVCNSHSGYLKLSFMSTYVGYIFNILPVIFPLYLLVTTRIQSMKLSSLVHYMIICRNTRSCTVACGTIRGCATNKNYYYINVACIQLIPHWGTNRGCGINWGNTVNFINTYHIDAVQSTAILQPQACPTMLLSSSI